MKTLHLVRASGCARVAPPAILAGCLVLQRGNAMDGPARAALPSGIFWGVVLGAAILSPHSVLANDANVVLYNQHTAEKGETEIEVFSDFANVGSGEPNYTVAASEWRLLCSGFNHNVPHRPRMDRGWAICRVI